jgi:hypothetical protein
MRTFNETHYAAADEYAMIVRGEAGAMRGCLHRVLLRVTLAIIVSIVGYSTEAEADADAGASMFSVSAFGTLGEVYSSEDKADFTSSIFQPNGAGFTHEWSASVDSRIGAQVAATFTPQLSGVVQIVAQQNTGGNYLPHVQWANLTYQFTPDLSIRAGRTLLPAFMLSEVGLVAYSYPWVRPPPEVYNLEPLTSNNGGDVSYRLHVGTWTSTFQASAGENDTSLPASAGGGDGKEDCWGISYSLEHGPLNVRITYLYTRLTLNALDQFFDAFRQFGPQGTAIANEYDADNKLVDNVGIGVAYDPGRWFVMSEGGIADTHSALGKKTGWYVSSGYRFGKLTPYLTYAQAKADNLSAPGLTVAAVPSYLAGEASGLNAGLNSILSTKPVQSTLSFGARWDFMRNVDLKVQLDHIRVGAGSTGNLVNPQPGFQLGPVLNVLSTNIDFVF